MKKYRRYSHVQIEDVPLFLVVLVDREVEVEVEVEVVVLNPGSDSH